MVFRLSKSTKETEDTSSEFSRFFRLASPEEKERVFLEVARKASADQMKILQATGK